MSDLRSAIESAVETEEVSATPTSVETTPVVEVSSDPATPEVSSEGNEPSTESTESVAESKSDKPTIEEVVGEQDDKQKPISETEAQKDARARVDRAPQSWKGEAKKVWETLPLNVRQEVARREREITQTMQASAADRQRVQDLVQVFTPHKERIMSMYGGNPVSAVANLLQAEASLTTAPANERARFVANMIKQYNVDVEMLDSYLAGQPLPERAQQLNSVEQLLEQRLAPIQQFLQSQQQREQQAAQQVEQQAVQTVNDMADNPDYPYFNEVREDMADIIEINAKKGLAISLPEAYNKAVRMNDSTFEAASVRDSTSSVTQQALNAHRAAQAAKGASVSVSGSPTGTGKNAGNPSDLRGTIASAFSGGRV